MMKTISRGFAARNVIGSREHQAAGIAQIVWNRNFISKDAAPPGTRSIHEESARNVITYGVGQAAFHAPNGLYTKIGMLKKASETSEMKFKDFAGVVVEYKYDFGQIF